MVAAIARQEFVIRVNAGETLTELLEEGSYQWVDPYVHAKPQDFAVRPIASGERKIVLLHFGCDISSEDATKEAMKQGLERPTHEDALRFGAQRPEVQRDSMIIFLHESVRKMERDDFCLKLFEGKGIVYSRVGELVYPNTWFAFVQS